MSDETRTIKRGTGQTTRMLRDAVIVAQTGREVLLVFSTQMSAAVCLRWLKSVLKKLLVGNAVMKQIHATSMRTWEVEATKLREDLGSPSDLVVMADSGCFDSEYAQKEIARGITPPQRWEG